MKSYAGIGSRSTPKPILLNMQLFAAELSKSFTLRTGGANGADMAFINGAETNIEIYIPSEDFNGFNSNIDPRVISYIPEEAFRIAKEFHPVYDKLKPYARKLMARNSMQILGKNLDDPVEFVVCYTHDGKASGGTGQAIRIAESLNIKIYNLAIVDDFRQIKNLIENPKNFT